MALRVSRNNTSTRSWVYDKQWRSHSSYLFLSIYPVMYIHSKYMYIRCISSLCCAYKPIEESIVEHHGANRSRCCRSMQNYQNTLSQCIAEPSSQSASPSLFKRLILLLNFNTRITTHDLPKHPSTSTHINQASEPQTPKYIFT